MQKQPDYKEENHMNLFTELLLQSVAIILGIVIVFQLIGKFFMKDTDEDEE